MIRRATLDDVPQLVAFGRNLHAVSPFAGFPADDASLALTMTAMLESDTAAIFLSDHGMIGVTAHPLIFNHGLRVGQEAFWWAQGGGMDLLAAAEAWAAEQGCTVFLMGALADDRSALMARLYRRAGFRPVEHFYMKGAA